MILKQLLLVFIGGGIGACLRFLLTLGITNPSVTFPWATFITNLLGCLLIGILSGCLIRIQLFKSDLSLVLLTGFCGGFTTFSTFSNESVMLWKENQMGTFILYNLGSVSLGILLVGFGYYLSK
ncbi:MAG: fluoride efflux transporter CrcB [Flavobacteriaceae bacterium]